MNEADQRRLEESRDIMRDLALPPGYGIGQSPDGGYMGVKEPTSEVFGLDVVEADLPLVVIDFWREYLAEAAPSVVARFAHMVTAFDALLAWKGELRGSPAEPATKDAVYSCTLCLPGNVEATALGKHDDPVEAILAARRVLLDLMEDIEEGERCGDEGDES